MRNSVVLIDMPWTLLNAPSIQLGILKSVLQRAGFKTKVCSFNLAFAHHIRVHEPLESNDSPFGLQDYVEVAEKYYYRGLGDWIFAVPPFRDPNEQNDAAYLEYFRSTGGTENAIRKARRMRELVPAFLESCVEEVLGFAPKVVGFTTTFSQNAPSLALAKLLKKRNPLLRIVFGGSNCDGPMGPALLKAFSWIDVVVRGEGDHVLPLLLSDIFSGRDIQPHPGLCYRQGEEQIVVEAREGDIVPMNEVPMPDYYEYFERLQDNAVRAEIIPTMTVPFESSRGCWWGAKKHCTFCGLNDATIAFRSKSPELVVEELTTLSRRHGCLDFFSVDNIIDIGYFRGMLPCLRDAGYDFRLFYETKANLKKDYVRALRDAGVLTIQPGIESLSTPILKLMEKGVTAWQNIRLLKWCAEFGLTPIWSIIYGFPHEAPQEYARMAEAIPSLTHLRPPQSVTPMHLERFSPYYERPEKYGVKITHPRPAPYYNLIYPCGEALLNDLAYSFEYSYEDGRDPKTYVAEFKETVQAWEAAYSDGANLTYRRGPGFLQISDRRPGFGGYDFFLEETEAKVYLRCDGGSTPMAVWKSLMVEGHEIELEDVEDFLQEMVDQKLMYEERGTYLSLAVATNPGTQDMSTEVEEVLTAGPQFVQLHRQVERQ